MDLIRLQGLERRYGRKVAFRAESLVIEPGVVGLLGANGAGKSTLLHVLLGLLEPSAGTAFVFGLDVRSSGAEIRSRIGYMPENDSFVPRLSAHALVALAGELCGMRRRDATRRAHEILGFLGVDESRYRGTEEHSTGMKQRIKLAQALVHDPELLILDEPTNGLDPQGRVAMLDLIASLRREEGRSIVMTSHLLEDVGRVSDALVVLEEGEVVASGRIDALRRRERERWIARLQVPEDLAVGASGSSRAGLLSFEAALHARGASIDDEPRVGGDTIEVVIATPPRSGAPTAVSGSRVVLEALSTLPATERPLLRRLEPWKETLDDLFGRLVGTSSTAWVGEEDLLDGGDSHSGRPRLDIGERRS